MKTKELSALPLVLIAALLVAMALSPLAFIESSEELKIIGASLLP